MNYRKHGFTQRKPKEPGLYFISTDGHRTMAGPRREVERWDVAEVIFFAGSYTNAYDNHEEHAHWLITSMCGLSYAWKPGMWLKGPIRPDS